MQDSTGLRVTVIHIWNTSLSQFWCGLNKGGASALQLGWALQVQPDQMCKDCLRLAKDIFQSSSVTAYAKNDVEGY